MPYDMIRILVLTVPALMLLTGFGIVCRGVVVGRRAAARRRTGQLASGVVVDNQIRSYGEGRLAFRPVVRFTPPGATERTILGSTESVTSHLVGTTVQVRYDPAAPDRAVLDDARPGRAYVGAGAAFLVMGLVAFTAFYLMLPSQEWFGSVVDSGWWPFGDDLPAGEPQLPPGWEDLPTEGGDGQLPE